MSLPPGPPGALTYDQIMGIQASQAAPAYQTMQEMNEWLERLETPADNGLPETDADAMVLEIAKGIGSDLGTLAVDVLELYLKVAEFEISEGVGVAMSGAGFVVKYTSGLFVPPKDREQVDLAIDLASDPISLVLGIVFMASNPHTDPELQLNRAVTYTKIMNALQDLGEGIDTLLSHASATTKALQVTKVTAKNALEASHDTNESVHRLPLPQRPGSNWATQEDWTADMAANNSYLRFQQTMASLQRNTFGSPPSPIWGDPQQNQYKLSNGQPSNGLNRYGDTLPQFVGGTFFSDDGEDDIAGFPDN